MVSNKSVVNNTAYNLIRKHTAILVLSVIKDFKIYKKELNLIYQCVAVAMTTFSYFVTIFLLSLDLDTTLQFFLITKDMFVDHKNYLTYAKMNITKIEYVKRKMEGSGRMK